MDRAWSGAAIEEARLRVHMAVIRKALGERQFGSRYISSIEEGAYSFVGSVVGIGL
jgi:DNA-binding winged helix-turn-helix (wHTH) protein